MSVRQEHGIVLVAFLLSWPPGPAASQEGAVALFNGRDLAGFYSYLGRRPGEKEPMGKNADSLGVFTVRDGMIRISGEVNGFLSTEQEHENFRLTVEFKWGEATHPPRKEKARASGVLYHVGGPDRTWPAPSLECQFIEGGTGNILIQGGSFTFEEELRPLLSPMIKLSRDGTKVLAGRIYRIGHDPGWQDVRGFRARDEVEKPPGEWNVLEIVSEGGSFQHILNGKVVARGSGAEPRKGRIALISEGAEIYFRKVEIRRNSVK
jgi:hypothetical protein